MKIGNKSVNISDGFASSSVLMWNGETLKWKKLIDKSEQQRIDRKLKLEKINALQSTVRKFN